MAGKFDKAISSNLEQLTQLLRDRNNEIHKWLYGHIHNEKGIIAIENQIVSCIKLLNLRIQRLEERRRKNEDWRKSIVKKTNKKEVRNEHKNL